MTDSDTAVAEPIVRPQNQKPKAKRQPRYHVILWDDPNHTFEYVIEMMKNLFRLSQADGNVLLKKLIGRAVRFA